MNIPSVSQHYRGAQELIRREVGELDAAPLEGTTVDEWIDYFMRKYSIPPIVLKTAPPVVEPKVDRVQRRGPLDNLYTAEHEVALIGLPVEPNENLSDLLCMRADKWSVPPPHWEYRGGCIFVEADPSPNAAKRILRKVK